jgi:peptidyl-dipeptidase A
MSTMLHEFGHGVYDWYLDPNLPPTLHRPAHILSTEAIAMLFGRLNRNAMWLEKILGLSESQVSSFLKDCQDQQALGMLIFVRWVLVMCHFERALYSNPDQNLNQLWWQFVERFQDLRLESKRDKPDWASKLHIALAPVYYQNYLMGELIASQLENYIGKNFSGPKGFIGKKAVGNYLREEYFKPGARLRWDHHLEQATKEKLNPDYFLQQFVK